MDGFTTVLNGFDIQPTFGDLPGPTPEPDHAANFKQRTLGFMTRPVNLLPHQVPVENDAQRLSLKIRNVAEDFRPVISNALPATKRAGGMGGLLALVIG